MADYYPLIARAIAGLDPSAPGESRRALYERARTALISQLRSVQPPLSEAEITRERLALEDAVRRVEADAVRRAASLPDAARTESRGRSETPASASPSAPAAPRSPPPPRRDGTRPGDALRESARGARTSHDPSAPPPARNPRGDQPQPPAGLPTSMRDIRPQRGDPRLDDSHPPSAHPPSAHPPSAHGMRDLVADANDLGRATAEAGRSVRRNYGQQDYDQPADPRAAVEELPYSYDESVDEAAHHPASDLPRSRIPAHERDAKPRRRFPVKTAMIAGLLLLLAGGGILIYQKVLPSVRPLLKPAAQVTDTAKDTGARPKITDRVGQPGATQVAPVAQRVVLYDEDPSSPQGKQFVGSVIWRIEPVKVPAGQPPDIAVRADIEVPERNFKMSMLIRRNTDASLPASHTVELTFVLPPDFGTTIANVPGILMKSNEQTRGTPLAGLAVKVTDGFFLVGLSNVEADRARNLQLLKERSWFDIPLVYANQRRSIIAIEKGAPGERAFNEAFTAWGE
jgi:hypothetical protein